MNKIPFLVLLFFMLTFSFSTTAQNIQGVWLSKLDIPNVTIRLGFRIWTNGDRITHIIHDSPDYGFKEIPVSSAIWKDDSL